MLDFGARRKQPESLGLLAHGGERGRTCYACRAFTNERVLAGGIMQIVWRALIGAALVSASVHAAADDAAALKYRQKVMDSVGGTMGAMGAIAKQEVTHPEHLAPLAHNMANLATIVPDVF